MTRIISLLVFLMGVTACAANALPGKINLLLVDVGTIDTVAKTEKFMTAVDKVATTPPPKPAAADLVVDPDLHKKAVTIDWNNGVAAYMKSLDEVRAENARRRKVLEGLRNSIVGNRDNRLVVIAKDYLASGLEEFSDFISVVDRSDASLSEVEKMISGHSQEEVAPATLFLSVTLGDLQHVRQSMQVGDTLVNKDRYSRKATAKVSDFNNVRVFSCDVTATYDNRKTDAVAVTGDESVIAEALIEDAMRQIARKVGAKFVKEFTVNVIVPKKLAEQVSPESVELYMDRVATGDAVQSEGMPITPGEPFKALSFNHTVTVVFSEEGMVAKPDKLVLGPNRAKGVVRIQEIKK